MSDTVETPPETVPQKPSGFAFFGLLLPAIFVALDQVTKWATMRFFGFPMNACEVGEPRETFEISAIFDLTLICNRGISWGMLQGDSSIKRWALTIFAFVMVILLLYALRQTKDKLGQFSLACVIGGALGNAIDRLFFGAVTDMLDFSGIGFNYIFNVADSFITIGVIGLFLSSFLSHRAEKKAASDK